ncbi:GlxA family transcriptional regulator [Pseudomonas orientalis]|uniref:Transcriptional regulator GlxA family, contains an amidase domain and an AraC-type DNA-binding HTH domain n=1 Tax=Pseudomonas orientalis TaxID=76758 RepID=A0A1H2EVH5_9PSED|nr:GlxA family transcriptional regulator [Pseudomonas orientalis]KRP67586.1 AraC family transcriptional regulator [Pseudomonas orientalis]SDT99146.1 Transcriptional regulator GlxA family, contains an amidase domain and an AraC-type DNA-binding HTH domain [Pseudomonas orientalis]
MEADAPACKTLGFLLLDQFTLISLSCAVEPLRMANQLAGEELYRWRTLSLNGEPVWASDGVSVTPDAVAHEQRDLDAVIVCGGVGIQQAATPAHLTWLRNQARLYCNRLGAVCTGSWALARAGLLDGFQCSVHWELMASLQEAFPRVTVSASVFSLDGNRFTSSGGTAPLDMMLHLIGRDHGHELAAAISQMFVYERIRNERDTQRVPLKHLLGTQQPKLQEVVALMEANLEEPIDLDQLAVYVQVSRRQLERMFQRYLYCTPSRYYLKLRLTRARQLLMQTPISMVELAAICGFVSTPHFSKCYRDFFGVAPSDERSDMRLRTPVAPRPVAKQGAPAKPKNMLEQAREESTFASVKIQRR